ncbi:isoprenoid biosynthesis glyoxalase ElbB [Amphritea sp. 2_MG-2023]|uniref:isoprenoid biosynthesis glyoxalase ElbB n=1 Tax=Amphritea TaxID=515417 RepID=UPI001C07AB4E|nr:MULTISPECIES: isoprenoid biosynthesis glyoxalase ElbB [Amphritea]MBU2964706.1 isoprenoid biosynthesis glyoxalase ElbB [Amphritea atlantica]MDO6417104.1 isoprenoid biosynthesis glyoxalase ElbB [Amphritea sp. 2_MG-2023]
MKKVAVVLSGCGVYDGSEIYESVLTLLAIEQGGASYQCMAPNIDQMHVINHRSGEEMAGEQRNVLTEAARLARGEIIDLADANPADYDALIIPGGFGAAKNLSDFAVAGATAKVNPDLLAFTQAIHASGKPVGLICIAPAMTPLLFGEGATCTIGNDPETVTAIEAMGGQHQDCDVDNIVFDEKFNLVTTPAYMLAGSISEAASGINKLVNKVLQLS